MTTRTMPLGKLCDTLAWVETEGAAELAAELGPAGAERARAKLRAAITAITRRTRQLTRRIRELGQTPGRLFRGLSLRELADLLTWVELAGEAADLRAGIAAEIDKRLGLA